ncbi:MAG: hypothetical protein JWM44_3511 [Bacilli bacterium]|nr:hypothetical protein [Bacilli bacterium]
MDIVFYKTKKGNSVVKEWLDALVQKANAGDKDAQDMVKHFFYCIERVSDGMPFSRPLQKGIFELRPQNSVTKHRITYCYWQGKILLLSEFQKNSGSTPDDQIKRAVKRKNDWIERHREQERELNRKDK